MILNIIFDIETLQWYHALMTIVTCAESEWLDSKQVKQQYSLNKQKLHRLLQDNKIHSKSLVRQGLSRGKRLWHHRSIKEYISSTGDGVHTKGDPDYQYNHAARHPFPTFVFERPVAFKEILMN